MQLVSSWFIPAPWVMVMRLVFAIVMVTFLALNIQKHFSAEYFASFFNLNFLFLGIYYAIMGVGGVYYVITYGKGKTYVFPSATLRKLMFMYGPIQAPLSVIGVIAYWLIRGAEGDTSYISIFTHGISIVLGGLESTPIEGEALTSPFDRPFTFQCSAISLFFSGCR